MILSYILILLAAATRLVPHLNNAAAITAVAIFSGANLPKKQAFAVPLLARLVTDMVLGLFAWQLMVAVYVAHLAGVLLGMWIINPSQVPLLQRGGEGSSPSFQKRGLGGVYIHWIKIVGSSLFAAILFFLVTNFAFLYSSYPHNWPGVVAAYVNGLPFFRGTLVGDMGYTIGLFLLKDVAEFISLRLKKTTTQPI